MNELDSELVIGSLRAIGYRFTPDAAAADVVLYNTCSVRELAEQKVWSRLGEMAQRKARQPALVVGVLGCMAEREGPALMKRMPVVDVMVGPAELDKLPGLLDNAVRTRAALAEEVEPAPADDRHPDTSGLVSAKQAALAGNTSRRSATLAAAADTLELLDLSRAVSPETLGPSRSAYVRITRGCNKFCTYCVVPFTRGAEVHRPPQHIIDECKRLADAGVIEVTLLGQTVNHYRFEHGSAVTLNGVVQPQKGRVYKRGESGGGQTDAYAGVNVTTFADLLRMIHDQVPAIERLRFVTSYPRDFGDDVLKVMRDSPRICRYLHVPAQSGSDRVLALMNRGYTVGEYLEFLDRARAILHQPEIGRPLTLAGDIIVGFPGETEEDFEATATLLKKARYKNCFIFKYSPRPGTVAIDRFADDIPDDVKRRRNNELLALQNSISDEVGREFVGQTLDVFVQGVSRKTAKAKARAAKHSAGKGAAGTVGLTVGGRTLDGGDLHDHGCGDDDGGGVGEGGQGACSTSGSHVHHEEPFIEINGPVQMTARTDGDLIVLFDSPPGIAPDDLMGTVQRVRIDASRPLALMGVLCDNPYHAR